MPPPYARNNIDKVKNNSIKYINRLLCVNVFVELRISRQI